MKRVLFVFAKLNRGLRYVQGMNELLAPIYYQFKKEVEEEDRNNAEADSFYCFLDLISEFRDHFCQQLVSLAFGNAQTLKPRTPKPCSRAWQKFEGSLAPMTLTLVT